MNLLDNIQKEFDEIEVDSLSPIRKDAFASFQKLGIPSARHEEWKYTNIKTKLPEGLRIESRTKNQEPRPKTQEPRIKNQ